MLVTDFWFPKKVLLNLKYKANKLDFKISTAIINLNFDSFYKS